MNLSLEQLTDLLGYMALERQLGNFKMPLPPPELIEKSLAEAYQHIWEILTSPDDPDEEEFRDED